MSSVPFPRIIVSGGPFERGRQHGQQAGDLIARHLDHLVASLGGAAIASAGNYVLAERAGRLLDVELTSIGLEVVAPRDDTVIQANHYEHPNLALYNAGMKHRPGSTCRAARLAEIVGAQAGRITVETMQAALSDRVSQPEQIRSVDGPYGMTLASMVAELAHGRLHVARGDPARHAYTVYSVP